MNCFFYGWYMKCQSPVQTLAVIPAVHQVHHHRSCSIQIITDRNAWNVEFPGDIYGRSGKNMLIGKNQFGERGVHLAIRTPEITAEGTLSFRCLTPLKYDIMGPFALIPFLECRHHVWSMQHAVFGTICINGENYTFQNDCGYWEGDSGRSFPGEYLWTQCFLSGGSIMLAAADIPLAGIHFTGITGAVMWKGKAYRLATYLGARAEQIRNGRIRIIQGTMELEAALLERSGHALQAPMNGDMVRTIHESTACRAFYRFCKEGHTLFEIETQMASFEYEFPE